MKVEHIKIQKILMKNNPNILSYPIYKIIDDNSSGNLIADTNIGEMDISFATKVGSSKKYAEFLGKKYIEWNEPTHMTTVILNKDYNFLNEEIEVHIEVEE